MGNLIWILTRVAGTDRGRIIIRLCLRHTSYLHTFLKLHISQTKKSLNFGSSHQSCSIGKAVLKNFINIHRKTTVLEALFNRVAGLRASNFIKRDSEPVILLKETEAQQHRCFPVNIAKFSRTPILKKSSSNCPWNSCVLLLIFLPRGLFLLLVQQPLFKVLFNV